MGQLAYWSLNELIVDLWPAPAAFDLLDPELLLGNFLQFHSHFYDLGAFSYVHDGRALLVSHRLVAIVMSSRIAPPQDR